MSRVNDAPCRYCGERRVGCHGQCVQYMEYANRRKKENREIAEYQSMINDIEYQNKQMASRKRSKVVQTRCRKR